MTENIPAIPHIEPSRYLVWYVDPDPTTSAIAVNLLRDEGYQAESIAELPPLTAIETWPDILVLAATAQNYQLCRQLTSTEQTKNLPVMIAGSASNPVNPTQAAEALSTDVVLDATNPAELLSRLKTQLKIHAMARQLSVQAAAFESLNARLHNELSVAQNIQRGLLPAPSPNWSGLNVECYTQSAREVGGDFYTYYAFDSRLQRNMRRYAIAIGDVSGKGMPAALLMAISLASFKNLITQVYSLNKLVADLVTQTYSLSQFLADLDRDIAFYTATTRQNCALVYVELSLPADLAKPITLRTVNAGCMMPIIRRTDGSVAWVEVGGMPLGAGLGGQLGYREERLNLSRGDMVILTSDGVVEANNSRHEMLGFERLEEIVRAGPQTEAAAMLNHIRTQVDAFVGNTEPHDDQTIVVMQV